MIRILADKDEILAKLRKIRDGAVAGRVTYQTLNDMIRVVRDAEEIYYVPAKQSCWIRAHTEYGYKWVCAECRKPYKGTASVMAVPSLFCPACGAIMLDKRKESRK